MRLNRGLKLAAHDPAEPAWLEEVEQWLYHRETIATTVVDIDYFTQPTSTAQLFITPQLSTSNGQLPSPKVFVATAISSLFSENVTAIDRFDDMALLIYDTTIRWKLGERDYLVAPLAFCPSGGMGIRLFSDVGAVSATGVAASHGFAPHYSVANVPVTIPSNQNHFVKFAPEGAITISTARPMWMILKGVLGREL